MPVLDSIQDDLSDLIPDDEAREELEDAVDRLMPRTDIQLEDDAKAATVFGRQMIHNIFGAPPAPPPPVPPFTYTDIQSIRDFAINRFVHYASRSRLDGMRRDLNPDDQRIMAFYEAAVEVLNRKGVLDPKRLEKAMPKPYTVDHEVNDEETVGHNFTQQKK